MQLNGSKISPKASCQWAKLVTPDTKFVADGEFSITLLLDPSNPEHEEFMADVDGLAQQYADEEILKDKKKKNWKLASKFSPQLDAEGDETGMMLCRFKQKAKITSSRTGKTYVTKKIPTIDAKRAALSTSVLVGNGSEVKVKFETRGYGSAKDKEFGVTLDLKAVQVINLLEGMNDLDGFDEEEGFEASENQIGELTNNFVEDGADEEVNDGDDF